MTIDLDKLEELAKAATPGQWRGDRFDGTVKYDIVAGDYPNGEYTIVCRGDNGNNFGFMKAEDEGYVLAANPAAILELCAEVRRLRERLEIDSRHPYDGIDCRDVTIRLQDEVIAGLREDAARYQYLRMCGRPSRVRLVDQYDMTKAIDAARGAA
jgi:hypothetical protein